MGIDFSCSPTEAPSRAFVSESLAQNKASSATSLEADGRKERETRPVKASKVIPNVETPVGELPAGIPATSPIGMPFPIVVHAKSANRHSLLLSPAGDSQSVQPQGSLCDRKSAGNRGSGDGNAQNDERFRLEHAVQVIDTLNARINGMERTEQRLRKQLRDEKERLKDEKANREGLLNLLVLAEEKVLTAETLTAVLRCNVDRYRGWWITEYYSLRAILGMLSRDQVVEARVIGEAAEERYASWLNMQD